MEEHKNKSAEDISEMVLEERWDLKSEMSCMKCMVGSILVRNSNKIYTNLGVN
jgi:hypothetical protein